MSRKRTRISSEEEMSIKLTEVGCGEGHNGSETSIVSGSSEAPTDALQVHNNTIYPFTCACSYEFHNHVIRPDNILSGSICCVSRIKRRSRTLTTREGVRHYVGLIAFCGCLLGASVGDGARLGLKSPLRSDSWSVACLPSLHVGVAPPGIDRPPRPALHPRPPGARTRNIPHADSVLHNIV
ncbi:hypothetical protein B5X24_HaOG201501 [Helicoverpa armigera]|nr:hypothetical protein B5X24_HaOG201501 [Helicoverpa armigera]